MTEKLNIYQRLLAVQKAIGYVKKDVSVPGSGRGVSRDGVVSIVRPHLLAAGIVVFTTLKEGSYVPTAQKNKQDNPLWAYVGNFDTHFVNVDDPSDRIVVTNPGAGFDYGDKGTGKASTYAEKLALLKTLLLETGIDDEGRNPGEGDDATAQPQRAPLVKVQSEPAAAPAAPAEKIAPPWMQTMVRSEAEAKGRLAQVVEVLAKRGLTIETMTAAEGTKLMDRLQKSAMRQPGEEG